MVIEVDLVRIESIKLHAWTKRMCARFWARGADLVLPGRGWVLRDPQARVPMSDLIERAAEVKALQARVDELEREKRLAFNNGARAAWSKLALRRAELAGVTATELEAEMNRLWPVPDGAPAAASWHDQMAALRFGLAKVQQLVRRGLSLEVIDRFVDAYLRGLPPPPILAPPPLSEAPPTEPTLTPARDPDDTADETPSRRHRHSSKHRSE